MAASVSIFLAWIAAFPATHHLNPQTAGLKRSSVSYLQLLKNRSFVFLLASTLIFAHCQSTVPNFLALIAAKKGITSGAFFFTSYFIAIAVLLSLGRLIDRFGKLLFLKQFYPIFSVGILLIPIMIDSPFYPISACLYGIGIGLLFPAHNALAAGHGNREEKPAVMSLFTAVYDTGFITGAVLSGWVAAIAGLDVLFITCGILGLFGLVTVVFGPITEN